MDHDPTLRAGDDTGMELVPVPGKALVRRATVPAVRSASLSGPSLRRVLPALPGVRRASELAAVLCLAGAALVSIGSFLAWIEVDTLFGAGASVSGWSQDGKLTLAGGLLAALAVTARIAGGRRTPWWAIAALGLVLTALMGYDIGRLNGSDAAVAAATGGLAHASVGPGAYACLVGALLVLVGGLAGARHDATPAA
jgi:hypothetical protein